MKATLLAVMLAVALQSGSGLTARSAVLLPDTLLHNVDDDEQGPSACYVEPPTPPNCKDGTGRCVCYKDSEGQEHCHWQWECE